MSEAATYELLEFDEKHLVLYRGETEHLKTLTAAPEPPKKSPFYEWLDTLDV